MQTSHPSSDPYEILRQSFIEALFLKRQHVVVRAPVPYSPTPLYHWGLNALKDVAIVLCPTEHMAQEQLVQLKKLGCVPPKVILLDGKQPPHELRQIELRLQRKEVAILITTYQHFLSTSVLRLMAVAQPRILAVLEAQSLLPLYDGPRMLRQWLERFAQLPNLPVFALFCPPISNQEVDELIKTINSGFQNRLDQPFQPIQLSLDNSFPPLQKTHLTVAKALTPFHQWIILQNQLKQWIMEAPQLSNPPGIIHRPLPRIVIHTHTQAEATFLQQKLLPHFAQFSQKALQRTNFPEHLAIDWFWYHPKQSTASSQLVQNAFKTHLNPVLVFSWGGMAHRLQLELSPEEALWQNQGRTIPVIYRPNLYEVFWGLPLTLSEILLQLTRSSHLPAAERHGLLLYAKTAYEKLLKRAIPPEEGFLGTHFNLRQQALNHLREWILTETCRKYPMLSAWEMTGTPYETAPMPSLPDEAPLAPTPPFDLAFDDPAHLHDSVSTRPSFARSVPCGQCDGCQTHSVLHPIERILSPVLY